MTKDAVSPEMQTWKAKLLDLPLQSQLNWNYSLKRFNTLRVGGEATCFIDVETLGDLSENTTSLGL